MFALLRRFGLAGQIWPYPLLSQQPQQTGSVFPGIGGSLSREPCCLVARPVSVIGWFLFFLFWWWHSIFCCCSCSRPQTFAEILRTLAMWLVEWLVGVLPLLTIVSSSIGEDGLWISRMFYNWRWSYAVFMRYFLLSFGKGKELSHRNCISYTLGTDFLGAVLDDDGHRLFFSDKARVLFWTEQTSNCFIEGAIFPLGRFLASGNGLMLLWLGSGSERLVFCW